MGIIGALGGVGGFGGSGFGGSYLGSVDDLGSSNLGARPLRLDTGVSSFQPDFDFTSPIRPSLNGANFALTPLPPIGGLGGGLDLGVNKLAAGGSPEPALLQLHPSPGPSMMGPQLNVWGTPLPPSPAAFHQLIGANSEPPPGVLDGLLGLNGREAVRIKEQIAGALETAGDRSQPWAVRQAALDELSDNRRGYVPYQMLTAAISGVAGTAKLATDPEALSQLLVGLKTAVTNPRDSLPRMFTNVAKWVHNTSGEDIAVDLLNPGKYAKVLEGVAGAGAVLGTIDKSSWKLYSVDPKARARDIASGIFTEDQGYIKSPFAMVLNKDLFTKSGLISPEVPDGVYKYVFTQDPEIIIFPRRIPNSAEVSPLRPRIYVHPEGIGGFNPLTPGAGLLPIFDRQLYRADLASGHFIPNRESFSLMKDMFNSLPENVFHPNFQGYFIY